jgi:catechol 2,3-dioxygenase-like lactoylglutathione lyase family enzyme
MTSVTGFNHVGIQVRDVERSARFYADLLGFEPVSRFSKSDPYVQKVVGYHPDVILEVAILRIPGSDAYLEILEYRGVDGTPVDPATANPGTAHFCVYVDGLDELHRRLVDAGVEFVSEPQTPTSGMNTGGRLVYMIDPDGIRVELVESERRLDGTLRREAPGATQVPDPAG